MFFCSCISCIIMRHFIAFGGSQSMLSCRRARGVGGHLMRTGYIIPLVPPVKPTNIKVETNLGNHGSAEDGLQKPE